MKKNEKIDKIVIDYINSNHINVLALERMIGCPKNSILNFLGGKNKAKFIKNKWLPSAVAMLSRYGLKLVPNQLEVRYPCDQEGSMKISYLEPIAVEQLNEYKGGFFKLAHKTIFCNELISKIGDSQHKALRSFLSDIPMKLDSLNKKYGFRNYYLYELRKDKIQANVNDITFQRFVVGLHGLGFKFFEGQYQHNVTIKRNVTNITLLEEVNRNEPYDPTAKYLAVKEVIVPKSVYQEKEVNLFISE